MLDDLDPHLTRQHVAVADTDGLHALVLDRLGTRPEVDHVRTSLIYTHARKRVIEPVEE